MSRLIVKRRTLILIISLLLLIPSVMGIAATRINYDMLDYLPSDMETVIGQNILKDEFGTGAFSFVVVKGMNTRDISVMCEKLNEVDHVVKVLGGNTLQELGLPVEILPQKLYDVFNTEDATLLAVLYDSSTSEDVTLRAVADVRGIVGKNCFVSGMSALVLDLKELCEKEEPLYVALAVVSACAAMVFFLDSWLIPFIFLAGIGMAIVYNLGSNFFLGEISYITKALSAVLQLAVTMDYSIFLWHSYNEQRTRIPDQKEAMANAIHETFISVLGSSVTTIAGFLALCFMSFTLGLDLGLVMAKGVLLGVLTSVTVLPALILLFDKPLQRTKHRSIIPNSGKFAKGVCKRYVIFLILFAIIIAPACIGYMRTQSEVYYDMAQCLPQDIDFVIANSELNREFDMASTHILLVDADLPTHDVRSMVEEMEQVDGVSSVLSLESVLGSSVPKEILPEKLLSVVESEDWKLLLISSQYHVASDNVGRQIDSLQQILKGYDPQGMLIGEAACTKDMIDTTGTDFRIVNIVSIAAIFLIIALVTKSITLPVILISVIELAIFINLGIPHYLGQTLPFIAPICISTIQLGATVDYAILLTTRYKQERMNGNDRRNSVTVALTQSIPSVIVSGMGLFAATFSVAVYSKIDIISSMCLLLARGAVVSVVLVLLTLPALLLLCDKIICKTTIGMTSIR